ncbi:hypothetical protein BJ138DRAFT_1118538 [Hygrophoropsis aurantiaca]|uniref:Uncharacterized protein n=1 Tax=Hygrophoropsis aurantiaca TaxID=72124 RepID=A0ACB7ZWX1_9AGAM|nr:hypothetical protein BJ138DRAFT_1118538 [Hygrophoropsis aurantiaca]
MENLLHGFEGLSEGAPDRGREKIWHTSGVNRPRASSLFSVSSSESMEEAAGESLRKRARSDASETHAEMPAIPVKKKKKKLVATRDGSTGNPAEAKDTGSDAEPVGVESEAETEADTEAESETETETEMDVEGSTNEADPGQRRRGRKHGPRQPAKRPCRQQHGYTATASRRSPAAVTFLGYECSAESHVDAAVGSFPFRRISQCPILSALQLQYTVFGFSCSLHNALVRPCHLGRHMKSPGHSVDKKRKTKKSLGAFFEHILASHRVPGIATVFPSPPQDLAEDIPGLTPSLSYRCPVAGCEQWRKLSSSQLRVSDSHKSIRWHVKTDHEDVQFDRSQVEARYIARPYVGSMHHTEEGSQVVFTYSELYSPGSSAELPQLQSRIYAAQGPAPVSADFLDKLGWPSVVNSFGADAEQLRLLVQVPTLDSVNRCGKRTRRLERGLLMAHGLLGGYLKDANEFVTTMHGDIRGTATAGSHAHYRALTDSSYTAYRRPLTLVVCLLLRMANFRMQADTGTGGDTHMLGTFPAAFWSALTFEQVEVLSDLYSCVMETDALKPATLLSHLHALLAALARHKIKSPGKMACAMDFSLCFGSLLPGGRYQLANSLTQDCAMLSHGLVAVIIHFVRLKDGNLDSFSPHDPKHYKKYLDDGNGKINNQEKGNNNDQDEDDGVDNGGDSYEDEVLADLVQDTAEGDFLSIDVGGQAGSGKPDDAGRKSLKDLLAPVEPPEIETSSMSEYAAGSGTGPVPQAQIDISPRILDPIQSNQIYMMMGRGSWFATEIGSPIHCVFPSLALWLGMLSTVARASILECLPPDCVDDFETFDWRSLGDDFTDKASVFQQQRNKPILDPLIDRLRLSLLAVRDKGLSKESMTPLMASSRKLDQDAAKKWLHTHDAILSAITACFVLTCGIPLRDFQFRSLLMDHDYEAGWWRNLFIVDNLPALGNPAAKQRDRPFHEGLWQVCQALSPLLLYFLGILRPQYRDVLKVMGNDAQLFDAHIYVHPFPRNRSKLPGIWTGSDINRALQDHTRQAPMRLTCGIMRNKVTAVFWQFFPWLCVAEADKGSWSEVDKQGQHDRKTGNVSYGRVFAPNIAGAIYGLAPPDEDWKDELATSPFFYAKRNEPFAFARARNLVCIHYGLGGKAAENRLQNLRILDNLFRETPYVWGAEGLQHPLKTVGDEVFQQVLHALVSGQGGATPFSKPPPGGYSVALAAMAVKLIVKAIEEWREGMHRSLDFPHQSVLASHFARVESKAHDLLNSVRDANKELWIRVSQAVHNYRPAEEAGVVKQASWDGIGPPGVFLNFRMRVLHLSFHFLRCETYTHSSVLPVDYRVN